MKKILLTFSIILATLFALSCQSDWYEIGDNGGGNRPTSGDGFLLRFNVPGSSINTRMAVPSLPGEDDVRSLHVLFFDATTNLFVDYMVFRNADGSPLDLSAPIRVQFRDNPLLNHSDEYRLLVVANIGWFLNPYEANALNNWLTSLNGESFASVKNRTITLNHFNATDFQRRIRYNELLMTAVAETQRAESDVIEVDLVRNVVRVDIELAPRLINAGYQLRSASIWNVPNNTALWNSDLNCFDQLTCIITGRPFQRWAAGQGNTSFTLYTFPNRQNNISQNDRHTTAAIIGIVRPGTTDATFHRVNISLPFAGQNMERNTVHNITVNRVLGDGAIGAEIDAAEINAYNADRSVLQVSVNQSDMDSQGVILVDGNNVLVLPTNRIVFCPEGGYRDLRIFTYSPDGSARLTVSGIVTPPGMTIILRGTDLYVRVEPGVDFIQGHIELRFGSITARIYVERMSNVVEYLELNLGMTDIERFSNVFPSGVTRLFMSTPGNLPDYVQVTSSGEWTARMFNEGFGFYHHINNTPLTTPASGQPNIHGGESGDQFRVAALDVNPANFVRYGFILFSLVSNPNINQVLVVTQQGTDLVEVYEYPAMVVTDHPMTHFYAGGNVMNRTGQANVICSGTNQFRLAHSGNYQDLTVAWLPTPYSSVATMQAQFTYTLASVGGNTILTITANPNQHLGNRIVGRLRITSPFGGEATINMEQGRYNLSPIANPATVGIEGGTTANITVAATHSIGTGATLVTAPTTTLSWMATISANNDVWGGTLPTVNPTTGNTGGAFAVTFPRLPLMMIDTSPQETVTITLTGIIDGTRTVTVTQAQRTPRNLYIRSGRPNNWGTWHPTGGTGSNRANFARLRDEIASTTNFGCATATMRAGARTFSVLRGTGAANRQLPADVVDIFLANNTNHTAAEGTTIRNWLNASALNDRVLIVTSEYAGSASNANNILGTWGYNFGSSGRNSNTRTVNGNANTSATHNFLFRDGPFRVLDGSGNPTDFSGQVSVRPRDAVANPLSSWDTTAEVILWQGTNIAAFTICPVRRVIALPEPEIFGTGTRTQTNWNNPANVAFVRNVAAWIVGVATYGDEFIEHINELAVARGI